MALSTFLDSVTRFIEHPIDSLELAYRSAARTAEAIIGTPAESAEAWGDAMRIRNQRLDQLTSRQISGFANDYLRMRVFQEQMQAAAPLVHGLTAGPRTLSLSSIGQVVAIERGAQMCVTPPVDCSIMSHPDCPEASTPHLLEPITHPDLPEPRPVGTYREELHEVAPLPDRLRNLSDEEVVWVASRLHMTPKEVRRILIGAQGIHGEEEVPSSAGGSR